MTVKVLIYLHTIICILFCAYGDETLNSDTTAILNIDLKQPKCNDNATLLEGMPARIRTKSRHINHIFYNNKSLNMKELNCEKNICEICIDDKSPGIKNYTFLILKGIRRKGNVKYGKDKNDKDIYYTAIYCTPTFHVRLIQTSLMVVINDVQLRTERTNLSVTDYDAVAEYKFREGELVDVSCVNRDEYREISLQYRDIETKKKLINTSLNIQIKLTSEDSGQYLTCKIKNDNDYAIVRVNFLMELESEQEDDIIVRVNGLSLRRQLGNVRSMPTFFYKFKINERVNVACEKRKAWINYLHFNSKGPCQNNANNCDIEKLTNDLDLKCEWKNRNGSSLEANIYFRGDVMQDFYILGLPPNNIIYKYRDNNKPNTIYSEYEYSDGENLNLTCMKNPSLRNVVHTLKWEFTDEGESKSRKGEKSKPITRSLVLTSANNNKVLKCLAYEILYEEDEVLMFSIALTLKMRIPQITTVPPTSSTAKENNNARTETESDSNNKTLLWGIGGGLCILILTMALVVYSISKKKAHRKRDSNVNYENLPNNTIPNPSQWNEEQYARPVDLREDTDTYSVPYNQKDVEKLYAVPQSKILRNKTKETNNYVNLEPTYSEVGKFDVKDCSDSNYAQVLPKSLRNNLKVDDKNNYANTTDSSNYAEVLPKNQRTNIKKDEKKHYVLPKDESNYAEIAVEALRKPDNSSEYVNLNKESHYSEVMQSLNNRNKYVNVIPNNEPYANINSSDYAEPAYCELNVRNNKK